MHDSIEVRYFGEEIGSHPAINASPDGARAFLVTQRGNLSTDGNIFELVVFDAQRPAATGAVLASQSNTPAIAGPRWIDGGRAIAFLGAEGTHPAQVYRYDLQREALRRLSAEPHGVLSFDMQGDLLIYAAVNKSPIPTVSRYPATFPSSAELRASYFRLKPPDHGQLYIAHGQGKPQKVGDEFILGPSPFSVPIFWISPDGSKAVVKIPLEETQIPQTWKLHRKAALDALWLVGQLRLIDVGSVRSEALLDAPSLFTQLNDGVLWAPDSKRVVLANTMLPLAEAEEELDPRWYLVDYDIERGQPKIIAGASLRKDRAQAKGWPNPVWLDWINPGRALLVTAPSQDAVSAYALESGTWAPTRVATPAMPSPKRHGTGQPALGAPAATLNDGIEITVRQNANEPPTVLASTAHEESVLIDSQPQLAHIQRAKTELIRWQSKKTHHRFEGLLMQPHRASDFGQIPMVIQIYGFDTDLFLPDGYLTTAYAAQPLASRGFAVLQVKNGGGPHGIDTPEEGPAMVDCLDSAVEYLASSLLVDKNRIGLIGFSRGAYNVDYVVTHPGATRFAAAVSAEGYTGSYGAMLAFGMDQLQHGAHVGVLYGKGGLFWQNKPEWIAHAPGFNLERIRTPILLSSSDAGETGDALIGGDLEFYVGLRLNEVPTDYLLFPNGTHPLTRPKQRYASLTASVDWMSYWTRGEEDADPKKAAQYTRWRALRDFR